MTKPLIVEVEVIQAITSQMVQLLWEIANEFKPSGNRAINMVVADIVRRHELDIGFATVLSLICNYHTLLWCSWAGQMLVQLVESQEYEGEETYATRTDI